MRRCGVVLLLLAAGCGGGGSPEDAGDLAYAEGRWDDADRLWREGEPGAGVTAKQADAAMISGDLVRAAALWTRLAQLDTSRAGEAASGLARVAQAAERADDELALAAAVIGLRQTAPSWPTGRFAMKIRPGPDAADEDVMLLAPAILAGAPPRSLADSLLLAWAGAVRRREGCAGAMGRFSALIHRGGEEVVARAEQELAGCELEQGLARLEAADYDSALRMLGRAAGRVPESATGRRALIAVGDVHIQMGDPFSAQVAWQTVASWNGPPDSLTALALERLRAMPSGDSLEVSGIP